VLAAAALTTTTASPAAATSALHVGSQVPTQLSLCRACLSCWLIEIDLAETPQHLTHRIWKRMQMLIDH
jgi:hypothetical protein